MNEEELEEKLAELRQKYRDLLGEGRTEDATEVYREAERLKAENRGSSEPEPEPESEPVESEDEGVDEDAEKEDEGSSVDSFEELKGVGDELAGILEDEFGSVEQMADASVEDLEPVPGIGEKKAESLLEQLN